MQGTILGWIDVELEDDVFLKLMTANFLTVASATTGIETKVEATNDNSKLISDPQNLRFGSQAKPSRAKHIQAKTIQPI